MPDGTSGHRPAEDEIDRRLRELTEERAGEARFREPSAAERAKAARKRSRQARKQARTRARKDPGATEGWRGGARHDLPASEARAYAKRAARATRRQRAVRATSWTVAIALLGGAAWLGYQHVRHNGSIAAGTALGTADGTSLNGVSQPTSTGPGPDPFAGTPADHWANGAAGIVAPTPNPAGPFTAAQVAGAYQTTRALLIAQDLNLATLQGGPPTAFASLLTARQRSRFTAGLARSGLSKYGTAASTRAWVASFAPGTTTLIGRVIKVAGTMSARAATYQGGQVLNVTVDYRFVYPVEPPGAPADWMRIVGQVSGYIQFTNGGLPGGPLQPWVVSAVPGEAGARCYTTDGFIHPAYPGGPPDTSSPSGAPVDPYSLKTPMPSGACTLTTGT